MSTQEILLSDPWTIINKMVISKFLLDAFGGGKNLEWNSSPAIPFESWKVSYNFHFPIKWALYEVYTIIPSITTIYPQSITYSACPRAAWGYVDTGVFNRSFELFLTKFLSQNFYLMHLGEKGWGRSIDPLWSLLTCKKWTRTFNYQSNEPSLKFIRASIP